MDNAQLLIMFIPLLALVVTIVFCFIYLKLWKTDIERIVHEIRLYLFIFIPCIISVLYFGNKSCPIETDKLSDTELHGVLVVMQNNASNINTVTTIIVGWLALLSIIIYKLSILIRRMLEQAHKDSVNDKSPGK